MLNQVLKLEIDKQKLEENILKEIKSKIKEYQLTKVFYSLEDLSYITSFSIGHIRNTFFKDKRFKKIRRKVGRKWVFPVKETNEFLKIWIMEQPHD